MAEESRNIDKSYPRAWAVAAVQIAVVLLLASLVLDGGQMFRAALLSLMAYLAMLAVIVARRPYQASPGDLVAIKCGFLLMYPFFLVFLFAVRGY